MTEFKVCGFCLNKECACHVSSDPRKHVATPFPLDAGPPYCCSRCSSVRRPMTNAAGTIRRKLMQAKWGHK